MMLADVRICFLFCSPGNIIGRQFKITWIAQADLLHHKRRQWTLQNEDRINSRRLVQETSLNEELIAHECQGLKQKVLLDIVLQVKSYWHVPQP